MVVGEEQSYYSSLDVHEGAREGLGAMRPRRCGPLTCRSSALGSKWLASILEAHRVERGCLCCVAVGRFMSVKIASGAFVARGSRTILWNGGRG